MDNTDVEITRNCQNYTGVAVGFMSSRAGVHAYVNLLGAHLGSGTRERMVPSLTLLSGTLVLLILSRSLLGLCSVDIQKNNLAFYVVPASWRCCALSFFPSSFFCLSSGGWGKIKLKLTTLSRIFTHVVCRFNSVAFAIQR